MIDIAIPWQFKRIQIISDKPPENSRDVIPQGKPWMRYFQLGLTQADQNGRESIDRFPDGAVPD